MEGKRVRWRYGGREVKTWKDRERDGDMERKSKRVRYGEKERDGDRERKRER